VGREAGVHGAGLELQDFQFLSGFQLPTVNIDANENVYIIFQFLSGFQVLALACRALARLISFNSFPDSREIAQKTGISKDYIPFNSFPDSSISS